DSTRAVGALSRMSLDHVNALDDHTIFFAQNAQHFALFALVAARDHDHLVALFYFPFLSHVPASLAYSTSGAREIIFMNCLARSSRVTGPKMRVPIGSPCL